MCLPCFSICVQHWSLNPYKQLKQGVDLLFLLIFESLYKSNLKKIALLGQKPCPCIHAVTLYLKKFKQPLISVIMFTLPQPDGMTGRYRL